MRTLIMRSIFLVFLFAQLKYSTSALHDATTFPSSSFNKLITMVTRHDPKLSHPSPHPAPEYHQTKRETSPPYGGDAKYLEPPCPESSNFKHENPCKGFITMVTDPYGGNRKPPQHPPPKAAPEKHQEELGTSSSYCQPGNSCRQVVTMVIDYIENLKRYRPPPPPPMPSAPIHPKTNSYGGNRKPPVYPPPKRAPEIGQDEVGHFLRCIPGSSCRKAKTMGTDSGVVSESASLLMRGYRRIGNFASSTTQLNIFSWMW